MEVSTFDIEVDKMIADEAIQPFDLSKPVQMQTRDRNVDYFQQIVEYLEIVFMQFLTRIVFRLQLVSFCRFFNTYSGLLNLLNQF